MDVLKARIAESNSSVAISACLNTQQYAARSIRLVTHQVSLHCSKQRAEPANEDSHFPPYPIDDQ